MISITPATEAQLSIVQAIAHQTWPDTFAAILSPEQIDYMLEMMYSDEALKTQMNDKNHVFLLAQETAGNTYLGFLSYELRYKGSPQTKIHKIYLLPASQGKGIGKQLIETVATLAKSQQNDTLSLNVNRHNKAIQFYERMGFAHVATEQIDIGNGFIMDDYVMEKPV